MITSAPATSLMGREGAETGGLQLAGIQPSSSFRNRLCHKGTGQRVIEQDNQHPSPVSTRTRVHPAHKHAHNTCTHTRMFERSHTS